VDAGEPFRQLQDAGIAVTRLDDIVRQRDPDYRAVVERLAAGDARGALQRLDRQGRVHEVALTDDRFHAIAKEYLKHPEGTLIVSPDNESRTAINRMIHTAMQDAGHVRRTEHQIAVLVTRSDVTGPDRQWAEKYEVGNVVRYAKGSAVIGLDPGEYGRVTHTNPKENLVTVAREDGSSRTYDPRRLQGVTLYREADRAFAVGDRVQFTAPDRMRDLSNRQLGVIEGIDAATIQIRLDAGRVVTIPRAEHLHLDHAYAVTSHSSQGQTADRVLVHIDTARGGEHLVNRRLAYVGVSRGRLDAQIYTNDRAALTAGLDRDVARRSATEIRGEVEDSRRQASSALAKQAKVEHINSHARAH
jgi:ATP-dependent exoDNAse (exonuclease V) alpha subunit